MEMRIKGEVNWNKVDNCGLLVSLVECFVEEQMIFDSVVVEVKDVDGYIEEFHVDYWEEPVYWARKIS